MCPPLERANLPPSDSEWRQFASTLPYIVGPGATHFIDHDR